MDIRTLILVENEKTTLISKTRNVLFIVLKKKDWAQELIEQVNKDMEIRYQNFIQQILPYLENPKLKNNINAIKCIMLKGVINILNKMMEERLSILSDTDKNLINEAFSTQNIIEQGKNEENNNTIKEKTEINQKEHNNNDNIQKETYFPFFSIG